MTVFDYGSLIPETGISGADSYEAAREINPVLPWGLAVVPLAAITLYSYNSSLRALHSVAEQESSAMASDMGSRMESVSRDLNRQIERFAAAFEFRRVMALDKKDRPAAMEALEEPIERLKWARMPPS